MTLETKLPLEPGVTYKAPPGSFQGVNLHVLVDPVARVPASADKLFAARVADGHGHVSLQPTQREGLAVVLQGRWLLR